MARPSSAEVVGDQALPKQIELIDYRKEPSKLFGHDAIDLMKSQQAEKLAKERLQSDLNQYGAGSFAVVNDYELLGTIKMAEADITHKDKDYIEAGNMYKHAYEHMLKHKDSNPDAPLIAATLYAEQAATAYLQGRDAKDAQPLLEYGMRIFSQLNEEGAKKLGAVEVEKLCLRNLIRLRGKYITCLNQLHSPESAKAQGSMRLQEIEELKALERGGGELHSI